ncbi:MAG: TetR/AcrR family transcriptional regulator [Planctomycetota bacterium]
MRSKSFSPDEARRRALERFWAHGYDGTNMPDLLGAMGITRGSFYDTFGSKPDLFAACFESYLDQVERFGDGAIRQAESRDGAVRSLLEGFLSITRSETGWKGCLIGNTAREPVATEPRIETLLADGMGLLTRLFDDALSLGADGRPPLPEYIRPVEALRLVAVLQGLLIAGRSGSPPAALAAVIEREVERMT